MMSASFDVEWYYVNVYRALTRIPLALIASKIILTSTYTSVDGCNTAAHKWV